MYAPLVSLPPCSETKETPSVLDHQQLIGLQLGPSTTMSSPTAVPVANQIVTANDHGALVSIAVYFLMTTFIVAVLIRLAIRLAITRSLGRDDYIAVAATVRREAPKLVDYG
jgi:hypothetical protein